MTSRTTRSLAQRSLKGRQLAAISVVAVAALGLAACSSGKSNAGSSGTPTSGGSSSTSASASQPAPSGSSAGGDLNGGKPVTLTWWHNANTDPGKSAFQKVAADFHAAHPNVTINVQPFQNEDIKTKIPIALQGTPPDIFQQWGGGALAQQIQSGKIADITQFTQSWIGDLGKGAAGWAVDGKQYGVPYDYHVVGFWYRTDLFQKAGISDPPATLDDLLSDITKLKAAGITPIALGGKDKWPDAFYWENFILKECPQDTIVSSLDAKKLSDPCFVKAGDDLKKLIDAKPFNSGFLSTSAQQGAGSSAGLLANGKAAMELQGDWEMAVIPPLTSDKQVASKMGFFPFPSVSGGQGTPGAALGGGDGFSCSTKAPDACAAFLQYLTSVPVETELIKANAITIPSNGKATDAIADPTLKKVLAYLQGVTYNQLYFDQYMTAAIGNAINDAVSNFIAGQGSSADLAGTVAKAASQ
ncbi:MAG TPA: extracellular solute-binding protein [Acidothermaceae bacterium]|nr:extracellular solute-binding protein [Acidothermaceae bacterium]